MGDLFSYKHESKGLSESARLNFLENAKMQLISNVKDAVGNLTRGILDVDGKIEGNTISLTVQDLRSESSVEAEKSSNLFNTKSAESFFNVVSEDEFKNRVKESAKQIHPELMRLFLESKGIFAS